MATLSERLAYVLTFDTTSGVKSLEKFGSTAEKELGKAQKADEKRQASAQKAGAAAVAFAGVAGVGLFKLAEGASDARQNFQALEQVVGDTAALDIKGWADGAAQSVGLSSSKAVEAATSFAQLGKLAGIGGEDLSKFSVRLVQLAADISAFKNVSPEQALQDIRSGFSGSVEVMRKYGIFLDENSLKQSYFIQTGERVTGTLTAQQRVLATNAELFRQGEDMLGQFGRESDQLVGQVAILKAELKNLADGVGGGLLPHFTNGIAVIGNFAEMLGNTSPEVQGLIGKLTGMGVGLVGIVGSMALVYAQAGKMRRRLTTMGDDGTRSLNGLGKASKALTKGFAALALAEGAFTVLNTISDNSGATTRSLQALAISAGDLKDGLGVGGKLLADFGEIVEDVDNKLAFSKIWTDHGKRIKIFGETAERSIEDIDAAFDKVLKQSPENARLLLEAWEKQGAGMDQNSGRYKDNIMLLDRYKERVDLAIGSTDALTAEYDENGNVIRVNTELLDNYNKMVEDSAVDIDRLVDAYKDYDDGVQGINDALEDSTEAVGDWRDDISAATQAGAEAFDDFEPDVDQSLQDYIDSLTVSNEELAGWQDDLIKIAELTSSDFAAHIGKMGPAAAGMAEEIAAGGPATQAAFDLFTTQAAGMSRDMEAEFDKVGPGATDAFAEARRAAAVEASLMLVELPAKGKRVGEEFSKSTKRGIDSFAGTVAQAAADMVNQAFNRISSVFGARGSNVTGSRGSTQGKPGNAFADGTDFAPGGVALVGEEGPELVELPRGSKVSTAAETASMAARGASAGAMGGAGGVTVQLVGDIYGVPSEEFVAELADKLNKYAAGMA
jgi:hypothetical protein